MGRTERDTGDALLQIAQTTVFRAQQAVDALYQVLEGRLAANPAGLCPVDTCLSFLRLCHSNRKNRTMNRIVRNKANLINSDILSNPKLTRIIKAGISYGKI